MQQSPLMKAPGRKQNVTDVGLWKVHRAEYFKSRTEERIRVYQCPMSYLCKCNALCRIIAGKDYKRLEFFGTHDEKQSRRRSIKNIKVKSDWSYLRFGYDCAEAVCHSTTEYDASQGQSG
jgi:hypothetical protein